MKTALKRGAALIIALMLISVLCAPVSAVASFPPGFLIGDTDGIRVTNAGEYYIYATDMEAGDVIKKTLVLTNTEDSTYSLTMTAKPLFQTGPIELLDKIHLRLILDGEEIYSGRVYGDGGINMIQNALQLGTYSYEDMRTLQIELVLDKTLPPSMFMQKSVAEIRWIFYAIKKEEASPPKTGEAVSYLLASASAACTAASLFLLWKRRKEDRNGANY